MEYQTFLNNIHSQIENAMADNATVTLSSVPKNNGTSLDALLIRKPNRNISPSIYLNPYYHRYLSGMSEEDIVDDILSTYKQIEPEEDFDISDFENYEHVKTRLFFQLVNFKQNKERLNHLPHVRFLDLAVIFRYMVDFASSGSASILISNEHASSWGVTTDTLYSDAMRSSPLLAPAKSYNINECLNLPKEEAEILNQIPMTILSNSNGVNGAGSILYENVLSQIADRYESDLVILPSSIHEVILIPSDRPDPSSFYDEMIQSVNDCEVADDEVLSDHAYFYSRANDQISL